MLKVIGGHELRPGLSMTVRGIERNPCGKHGGAGEVLERVLLAECPGLRLSGAREGYWIRRSLEGR
jgi:hypothetical protein